MNEENSTPPLLTVLEACELLKCSQVTFRKFAREYNIPICGYHSRSHRYDSADIMAAVERSKKPQKSPTSLAIQDTIDQKAASILRG